jgi:hypothetical protein
MVVKPRFEFRLPVLNFDLLIVEIVLFGVSRSPPIEKEGMVYTVHIYSMPSLISIYLLYCMHFKFLSRYPAAISRNGFFTNQLLFTIVQI